MPKLNKDFFTGNKVLFVGYSEKNKAFSNSVYRAFIKNGITVYPLNNKEGGNYDIKVYRNLNEVPDMPESAYILLNKDNSKKVIKALADKGIKRILFQSKNNVSPDTIDECRKMGIEAVTACPMMILGSALHRFHGFIAGVRK